MALRLAWNSPVPVEAVPTSEDDRQRVCDPFVPPEGLFEALDGRNVTVSGHSWKIEPYSVRDDGGERWVQLALKGRPDCVLTLKLAAGAGLQYALMALASWLASPAATDILNVA
jgi:hypothetical protein